MTENREDYLKVIFKLSEEGEEVSNKMISSALHIAPASVSEMLKKLESEGYVHLEGKVISLTESGTLIAKNVISKHRLWETFLLRFLDYNWGEVHELAERFEHITDEQLKEKLNAFLHYPDHCPHGSPIYANADKGAGKEKFSLAQCRVGDCGRITKVDDLKAFLSYLDRIHLHLGTEFEVLAVDDFDRSLCLRVGEEEITVAAKALRNIYVEVSAKTSANGI